MIDVLLDGGDVSDAFIKNLLQTGKESESINKVISQGKFNAKKIYQDQQMWKGLRLSRPEMAPYINRLEEESQRNYKGVIGEDGSVNEYTTAEGPGYIDVYAEAARLYGLAAKNFTQKQLNDYDPRIEPFEVEKADGTIGIIRRFVTNNPDSLKTNHPAMDKALIEVNKYLASDEVRQYFDFVMMISMKTISILR